MPRCRSPARGSSRSTVCSATDLRLRARQLWLRPGPGGRARSGAAGERARDGVARGLRGDADHGRGRRATRPTWPRTRRRAPLHADTRRAGIHRRQPARPAARQLRPAAPGARRGLADRPQPAERGAGDRGRRAPRPRAGRHGTAADRGGFAARAHARPGGSPIRGSRTSRIPQARLLVEVLQQSVRAMKSGSRPRSARRSAWPPGFNSQDGD